MDAKLDEKDSEIVIMRHYELLTNQEIAQALDLSEPAASMRYLRAVRRLKRLVSTGVRKSSRPRLQPVKPSLKL